MNLFTQVELTLEGKTIPPGAYTIYIIPGGSRWILVVNKGVTAGAQYDEAQDLLRISMKIGHFGSPQSFQLALAHIGPKQCNLRMNYGKVGTWTEFSEQ